MNKKVVLGIIAGVTGIAAGVATGIAVKKVVDKISAEMERNQHEVTFTSPEGNNVITLLYGSSESACGLTRIRITATQKEKMMHAVCLLLQKATPLSLTPSGLTTTTLRF